MPFLNLSLLYNLYIINKNFLNHENPTTLDYASLRPEFARPTGSGRIFRMPKIENSFAKKDTLDFTSLHPEFSIFVHNKTILTTNTKNEICAKVKNT